MTDMQLLDGRGQRRTPYLVFTSAGDRSNLNSWLKGSRNFDLWITYYGDQNGRFSDAGELYNARKGSKFQNLKFAYKTWAGILAAYEAVMVMDDDILISAEDINSLFELRKHLDLWVLQPAFSPFGKITFPITRVQPRCELRYTDFVEMTCPLFRKDKLDKFMSIYDPALVGYGIESWFLEVLGQNSEGKVAVVDKVTCINPYDRFRGGVREITSLLSWELHRANYWETISKYSIADKLDVQREFQAVMKPLPMQVLSRFKYVLIEAYIRARHLLIKGWPTFSYEPSFSSNTAYIRARHMASLLRSRMSKWRSA